MKKCSQCGFSNPNKSKFCSNCGGMIDSIPKEDAIQEQFALLKDGLSDKFDLIEEIGKGGMSIVYKAIQKNLDRTVALKVINSNLMLDAESVKMFNEEAKIAASLKHPNIITIYDQGESNGYYYIAMEYLEGEELSDIIDNQGPLDSDTFIEYFTQLADALNYLSDRQLLHLDIKCSNIMITKEDRPVILDFGIAKLKSVIDIREYKSIIGTPEYMSPEQASGGIVDERSDLYSLGIVMYKCLTRMFPFTGKEYTTVIEEIQNKTPLSPTFYNKKIQAGYEDIIIKLLQKNPNYRYQSGTELKYALMNPPRKIVSTDKILKYAIIALSVFIIGGFLLILNLKDQSVDVEYDDDSGPVSSETNQIGPSITSGSTNETELLHNESQSPLNENSNVRPQYDVNHDPAASTNDRSEPLTRKQFERERPDSEIREEPIPARTPNAEHEPRVSTTQTSISPAEASSKFDKIFNEAVELFDNGEYDEALKKFNEADGIIPDQQSLDEYRNMIKERKVDPD